MFGVGMTDCREDLGDILPLCAFVSQMGKAAGKGPSFPCRAEPSTARYFLIL